MDYLAITALPSRVKSHIGARFGRLVVVGFSEHYMKKTKWVCDCDCGARVVRRLDHMQSGASASCGCLNRESQLINFEKHGHAQHDKAQRHPLYSTWCDMKKRCHSPTSDRFVYYGGRGISVCDRWRGDFVAFAEDMGDRPAATSIDRIDNDGNYEPGNCRWATKSTQMKNRRPFTRKRAGKADDTAAAPHPAASIDSARDSAP